MARSLVLVIGLTVFGDVCVHAFGLPIPGAAIGMAILVFLFGCQGRADAASAKLFDIASPHFPLFFVPAAVGVIAGAGLLASAWLYFVAAIVGSTVLTLLLTGLMAQSLLQRSSRREGA